MITKEIKIWQIYTNIWQKFYSWRIEPFTAYNSYLSAKSVLHTGGHMQSLTHRTCHYRSMKREGEQSMLYHWLRVLDFGPDFFWRAVEGLHCLPKWKIISVNVESCTHAGTQSGVHKVECKQVNYTSQKLDSNLYFSSIHNSSIQFFPCFHCISRIHKCHKSKTLENTVRDHFPSHHFIVSDWFKIDRTFTLGFLKNNLLGVRVDDSEGATMSTSFFFFFK